MVKGLYTAFTGMVNSQKRLDVVSNNIANSQTYGYKKEGCTTQSFDAMYAIKIKDRTVGHLNENVGSVSLGVKIGETYRNFEQGAFITTEAKYDFALSGKGFFNIEFTDKQGNTSVMYTRDGSFQLDKDGYLLTKDGDYVLGASGGPIVIPTNTTQVAVDELGNITADGEYIDAFALTDFEDYNYLEKYGENMFRAVDGATETDEVEARVNQGYVEASNINPVQEMVEMITIAREYESGQKVINSIDEMLGRMIDISEI
jgi:flagellar basal-body rod protein FlgG